MSMNTGSVNSGRNSPAMIRLLADAKASVMREVDRQKEERERNEKAGLIPVADVRLREIVFHVVGGDLRSLGKLTQDDKASAVVVLMAMTNVTEPEAVFFLGILTKINNRICEG